MTTRLSLQPAPCFTFGVALTEGVGASVGVVAVDADDGADAASEVVSPDEHPVINNAELSRNRDKDKLGLDFMVTFSSTSKAVGFDEANSSYHNLGAASLEQCRILSQSGQRRPNMVGKLLERGVAHGGFGAKRDEKEGCLTGEVLTGQEENRVR